MASASRGDDRQGRGLDNRMLSETIEPDAQSIKAQAGKSKYSNSNKAREIIPVCKPGMKYDQMRSVCTPVTTIDIITTFRNLIEPPLKAVCKNITTVQGVAVCEDYLPRQCTIVSIISSGRCEDIGDLLFEQHWSARCTVRLIHIYDSKHACPSTGISENSSSPSLLYTSLLSDDDSNRGSGGTVRNDDREYQLYTSLIKNQNKFGKVLIDKNSAEGGPDYKNLTVMQMSSIRVKCFSCLQDKRWFTKIRSPIHVLKIQLYQSPGGSDHGIHAHKYTPAEEEGDAPLESESNSGSPSKTKVRKMIVDRSLSASVSVNRVQENVGGNSGGVPHLSTADPEEGSDVEVFRRLFAHMYSGTHYYLIHMDASRAQDDQEMVIRRLALKKSNVFVLKELSTPQKAVDSSSTSKLLVRAMAWYLTHSSGWDYFVSVTDRDYPLMTLMDMERRVVEEGRRWRPGRRKAGRGKHSYMPFLTAWTNTLLKRINKDILDSYEGLRSETRVASRRSDDGQPANQSGSSLTAVQRVDFERVGDLVRQRVAKVGRAVPSALFGPPLECNGVLFHYWLENRRNISLEIPGHMDTQWLFSKAMHSNKLLGFAATPPSPRSSAISSAVDGAHRLWVRSSPATTALYDHETVEYIVNSAEGRRYFHFFKNSYTLVSEHYLGSLLFNWERTRDFVTSLRSLSVWTLDQDENGTDIKLFKEPKTEARKFSKKAENEDSTFAQMRVLNETNLELMASL
eukprot:gene2731-3324_t